jgi:hypothetical protein
MAPMLGSLNACAESGFQPSQDETAKYDKTIKGSQKPFHHQMANGHHIIFTGKDAGDRKTLVFG